MAFFTKTQLFLEHLRTTPGILHRLYRKNGSLDGPMERVFCSFDFCLNLWKQNPEVIILDCT